MYVYVCVCVCVYTCICMYVCICVYMYVYDIKKKKNVGSLMHPLLVIIFCCSLLKECFQQKNIPLLAGRSGQQEGTGVQIPFEGESSGTC